MGSGHFFYRKPMATFRGKHNSSKSKAIIVLNHRKYQLHKSTGLSARELYLATGVNYAYLQARLNKWVEWHYLNRYATGAIKGRPLWHYRISTRGTRFMNDILNHYYPTILQQYVQEINEFTSSIGQMQPAANEYKHMKDLVAAVNEQIASRKTLED